MDDLSQLAFDLDPERAARMHREFANGPAGSLGVVLATAYPALEPRATPQQRALSTLSLEELGSRRTRQDLRERLAEALAPKHEPEEFRLTLRRALWLEKARIALRELLPSKLGGASMAETARELSELADTALEVTIAEASSWTGARYGVPQRLDGTPGELCVLGMGKLGGHELNAGSDIDIVFVYDSDEPECELSAHDYFARVARRAVQHLSEPTTEGIAYRVDLRLRPEGSQGALVNSLAAFERYYETWGRLWERAAMLRARPAAGSSRLGAALEREVIQPFVYRREVDPNIAHALADMLLTSRAELCQQPERDLKLGPGGIREAEFFVQALQLIWGGQEPSLRVRGTLLALERLRLRGFVSDAEAGDIARAYMLLRRAEHAVQWSSGIQTHSWPTEGEECERLARVLGYPRASECERELEALRSRVSAAFASLAPGARVTPRHRSSFAVVAAEDELPDHDLLSSAASRLFPGTEVSDHLRALARRPDGLLGKVTCERFPALADQVLGGLGECPDAEQAARYLRLVFARLSAPGAYVAALAEDLRALSRLLTVLGSSAFIGQAIVTSPELLDIVLFGEGSVSDVAAAIDAQLLDWARHAAELDELEREEALVTALRQVKSRIMVEVAIADLAGALGTRRATRTLSELAERIMQRVLQHLLGQNPQGLCILAVGKLGGRELGYGSDIDLLFIYDARTHEPEDDAGSYFTRQAQRFLRLLSEPSVGGPGYVMDTRLRPSGSHGLLVASVRALASYHGVTEDAHGARQAAGFVSGAAWERQALIRARFCAGDAELGRRAISICRLSAYAGGPPPAEELHRMRLRLEHELGRERPLRREIKVGRGGLLDIEFLAQWLQMKHGSDERVRTPDTAEALDALSSCGYLARADYELLRDSYRFLRRLEQRLHVHRGDGTSFIDEGARDISGVGRSMGFQSGPSGTAGAQLFERYVHVTEAVRARYLACLGLAKV